MLSLHNVRHRRTCPDNIRRVLFGTLEWRGLHREQILSVVPWNSRTWTIMFQCVECGTLSVEGSLTDADLVKRGISVPSGAGDLAFSAPSHWRPVRPQLAPPDVLTGFRSPHALMLMDQAPLQ